MRAKARANQGGSIVSFIIVGTLLLAGLAAGVYYVSRDDGQDTGQVAETDNSSDGREDRSPIAEGGRVADPDEERDQSDDDQPGEGSSAPAPEPEEEPEATQPEEDESEAPEQIASTGGPGGGVEQLPQSGPAEVALSLVALFAVTFVVVTFRRSRLELAREISGKN